MRKNKLGSIHVIANYTVYNSDYNTRGSGCGQPQAGSALNEELKLNLNDVDYNMFQLNQRSQIIS